MLGSSPAALDAVDLRLTGCNLHKNGELAGTGACGAVLGSPLRALVWLANTSRSGTWSASIRRPRVWSGPAGAAVQGHSAEALALAANDLGRRGLAIEPGWIVLTGGMTDAVAVPAGAVLAAHFTHLGSPFLP